MKKSKGNSRVHGLNDVDLNKIAADWWAARFQNDAKREEFREALLARLPDRDWHAYNDYDPSEGPLLDAVRACGIDGANRGEHRKIDWVIAGGESGHHARPMHPEWLTFLRDQCVDANINFHFKQWGNWRPIANGQANGRATQELLTASGRPFTVANIGKKAAGRLLQGRTWDEFPGTNSQAE